ncbi:unnamed protein product [Malus baccata var. baccata]
MMKLSRFFKLLCVVLLVFVIVFFQKQHIKHKDLHITSRILNRPWPSYHVPKIWPPYSSPSVYPKSPSVQIPESPPPDYLENPYKLRVFNVLDFGALGNGVKDDTEAFKDTWNAVCQAEIGTAVMFLVPNNLSFLIQPIVFEGPCKSRLVFQIEGTLMPPDGPDQWPPNTKRQDWLLFKEVHRMLMQGNGLLNGRGEKWWDLPCKPHKNYMPADDINFVSMLEQGGKGSCDSPSIIRFSKGSDLFVRGLRLENSPKIHIRFDSCEHVSVESISIISPEDSPNTDGIHIEDTTNAEIHHSTISTGDDCVSIGTGCYNVDISYMTCGPSHGISIGSLGEGNSQACVTNITVSDSIIKNSDNGVRIKTWQGGSGMVSKVTFKDIHMDIVLNPIIINQFYCLKKQCSNQTSAVLIDSVQFSNIMGTYDSRKPPIHLACSDSLPCKNLTLSGIHLLPAQGGTHLDPFCSQAFGTKDAFSTPRVPCLMTGYPKGLENEVDRSCF